MDLIVWRHGQTDYNAAGRVQGRVDVPLNDVGLAQARAAADELVQLAPLRIVSSPLARARATAQVLAERIGCEVEVVPALTERDFGAWEGCTRQQIAQGWPEQYAVWRRGGDPHGCGVETRGATAERVGGALRSLAPECGQGGEHGAQVVVAVAHGAAITMGVSNLLGLDAGSWFGLRGLDNARYGRLRTSRRSPGWMLVDWNRGGA